MIKCWSCEGVGWEKVYIGSGDVYTVKYARCDLCKGVGETTDKYEVLWLRLFDTREQPQGYVWNNRW
jgi:hypothetical protein